MQQVSPSLQARINTLEMQKQENTLSKNYLTNKPDSFEYQNKPEEKVKKEVKKLNVKKILLAAAAVLAVAGAVTFAVKNGKSVKLSDVKFDKGVASLQNGEKFTGKIADNLKNGDKIVMKYKDGVLQKSTRSGSVNFSKIFTTAKNGDKIIKTKTGKTVKEFNVTKNRKLLDIFSNKKFEIFCTGEAVSCQELFDKYLKDYDLSGKTLYHGTGYETAQAIKDKGISGSIRGEFLDKFNGGYFSENIETAKIYANQAKNSGCTRQGFSATPIKVTSGGIVQATMPEGSKLARFVNDEGKFLSYDLIGDVFESKEIEKALEDSNLSKGDLISYIQDRIVKKGYDGILNYETHTGATPVILNRDKLQYGEILKV